MTYMKRASEIAVAVAAAAALTGVATSRNTPQFGQSIGPGGDPEIVGAWKTRIRPRDCATGDVLPVDGIRGLFSFHEGGTISEYGIGPGATPALRSPSPDGRWLLATVRSAAGADVWLLAADGSPASRPLLAESFVERDARVSPDGRSSRTSRNERSGPKSQSSGSMARRPAR